ncbi:SH3 domain-containing protein [Brevibacillus brevis]|uniref:SH3 domain-containing protein n=1 Tax=Brevibacillus brevis TaxID=1393 RepID=UPI000D10C879|nr:SH3 domain-containing protein [Brevibacillus brevis]PSJ70236.1 hypothetical protein C7J99_06685 [Brevibacillus brevis]RED30121.1 SH3 domain-containing protein [Brevibacillus brevis]GEC88140.1 hypothetical protein BBR01nite_04710 [Brevibacillus brevis]VEF88668.1 Bacterial protein of uncharacterised function (DUF948) [Brevibacillus brevis]
MSKINFKVKHLGHRTLTLDSRSISTLRNNYTKSIKKRPLGNYAIKPIKQPLGKATAVFEYQAKLFSQFHNPFNPMVSNAAKSIEYQSKVLQDVIRPINPVFAEVTKSLQYQSKILSEFQNAIRPINPVFAEVTKTLQYQSKVLSQFQNAIRPINPAFAEVTKTLQYQSKILSQFQNAIRPLTTEVAKTLQYQSKVLAQFQNAIRPINPAFAEVTKSLQYHSKLVSQVISPEISLSLSHSLQAFQAEYKFSSDKVNQVSSFLNSIDIESLQNLRTVQVEADENVRMNSLSSDQISEVIRLALEESGILTRIQSLESSINKLIIIALKFKEPFFKTVILSIVLNLVSSMIFWVFQPALDEYRKTIQNKPQSIKQIKSAVSQSEISKEALVDYRFVSADTLSVRQKPSSKSSKLSTLYFGTFIRVVETRKDWSLVEWTSDDTLIRGWVFSRYLEKFK